MRDFETRRIFPCVPELVRVMGSEIQAVIVQTVLCALLGMVFAASSVIWEFESWSIARQTGLYFLVTSAVMMPFAYFLHWMEHSLAGFLSYLGVFAIIFILIWLFQYMIIRHNIKKINSGLK